jgi:hypothetical protein
MIGEKSPRPLADYVLRGSASARRLLSPTSQIGSPQQADYSNRTNKQTDSNPEMHWFSRVVRQAEIVTWFTMSWVCVGDSCKR